MSNRNRTAGNNFERLIVRELKLLNFDVVTSRSESRNMDNLGVDIFSPLGVKNIFPFYIQCKNSQNKPNYHELIKNMPNDRIPIILHRQTHKVNSKFITDGDYVIIKKQDFYSILQNNKKENEES